MKQQRIYVDTSVIAGCFDKEFELWSNGLMADFRTGYFRPVTSPIVTAELVNAPLDVRLKYDELLAMNAETIAITDSAIELAEAYQRRQIISKKLAADALHIAVATVAEVDLLVSWNFKHIVRFDKIRMFNAVNLELGYKRLEIYSPREVTHYGEA